MKKTKKLTTDRVVTGVNSDPEFVDHKGLFALFGIGRSLAYVLTGEGKIRSVSLRRKGYTRGKRLWDCASVRKYLKSL